MLETKLIIFFIPVCCIVGTNMLRRRAVTKYLERVKTDGVQSVMLFTMEGMLLSHTKSDDEKSQKTTAAIAGNVWQLYQQQVQQYESVSHLFDISCTNH